MTESKQSQPIGRQTLTQSLALALFVQLQNHCKRLTPSTETNECCLIFHYLNNTSGYGLSDTSVLRLSLQAGKWEDKVKENERHATYWYGMPAGEFSNSLGPMFEMSFGPDQLDQDKMMDSFVSVANAQRISNHRGCWQVEIDVKPQGSIKSPYYYSVYTIRLACMNKKIKAKAAIEKALETEKQNREDLQNAITKVNSTLSELKKRLRASKRKSRRLRNKALAKSA